jgi:hypothetical protein
MLAPHVFEDTSNSLAFVPVIVVLDMLRAALVLFVTVTVFAVLDVPSA